MRRQILVCDDNAEFLELLVYGLESQGFDVTAFASADAALEVVSDDQLKKYDVIITDLEMPGTDGDEFAIRIRALNPTAEIFVISGSISKVSSEAAQFATLIEKPFSIIRLVKDIAARFANQNIWPDARQVAG